MSGGSGTPVAAAGRRLGSTKRRRVLLMLGACLFGLLLWVHPLYAGSAPAVGLKAHPDPSSAAEWSKPNHPGDAPFVENARRIELPIPSGYNTHDGGWIKYSYHPSVIERIQPLIQEADDFRAELARRLGKPILQHVDVRIARTPGEMRSLAPPGTEVPSYAAGVAYSQLGLVLLTIQPLHPNSDHNLLEIFKHELVHIALSDAVGGQHIPRWFNEGFAVQASGENRTTRMWTLWSATLSEDLIPLSRLEGTFPANPNTASVAYAEAADFVRYLMRNRDEHRFRAAIDRVRAGQPFVQALGDAYGTEITTLEYEWLEDVARRYTFWPVLFSSTVIWMGVLGLLVWGWRRRKARADLTLARWAREEAQEDLRRQREMVEEAPRRVHIVLSRPSETDVPEIGPTLRESGVPKVEHDGRWHTLH